MPIGKHFGGHGEKVMSSMKKQYGEEKGERVFYATDKKRGKKKRQRSSRPKASDQAAAFAKMGKD